MYLVEMKSKVKQVDIVVMAIFGDKVNKYTFNKQLQSKIIIDMKSLYTFKPICKNEQFVNLWKSANTKRHCTYDIFNRNKSNETLLHPIL